MDLVPLTRQMIEQPGRTFVIDSAGKITRSVKTGEPLGLTDDGDVVIVAVFEGQAPLAVARLSTPGPLLRAMALAGWNYEVRELPRVDRSETDY